MSSSACGEVHGHVVNFYDDDDLTAAAGPYLLAGLEGDDGVVVIATPTHRQVLDAWLSDRVDLASAKRAGRYVAIDARATLDTFMVEDKPDATRFADTISRVLRAAGRRRSGVRAFGEMVGLLWDSGRVLAAAQLEDLWNHQRECSPFTLYCAYRAASIAGSTDLETAARVCASHSSLISPPSYASTSATSGKPDVTMAAKLFLPTPDAIAAARRFVASAVGPSIEPRVIDDAVIVVSELATNALFHASGPFRVIVSHERGGVRVGVEDRNPQSPVPRVQALDAVAGRGIHIIDRIAKSWGVESRADGKLVWASLA